jgi:hypothetical protein
MADMGRWRSERDGPSSTTGERGRSGKEGPSGRRVEDEDWGEGPDRIRKRRELECDMWVESIDVFSR